MKSAPSSTPHPTRSPTHVGWREWASLPGLGIRAIKVKVDTGARTSALHAFEVNTFVEDGREWVRFRIHPLQDNTELEQECVCPVLDRRQVTDSGGHREERIVIQADIAMGGRHWPIEITLTDRETMKFRMLLGRTAMHGLCVNPQASFLLGGNQREPL
ncbi:ATP-dependent zinc protease family protein [Alcanivorax quisquiliarum]|uniref:ATP-dependent zinc protease n=1 Tax=Alcanivorax quisquiliarum TaxID=2933565 RepID=A0ABT0E7N1_9GAMM|nr:ATP-dependent zinc protease [Alcanivorax quisquiliarum]MCK0537627.1 ATP-dependent zinc protease [Alcanivorax quisquiliarum]